MTLDLRRRSTDIERMAAQLDNAPAPPDATLAVGRRLSAAARHVRRNDGRARQSASALAAVLCRCSLQLGPDEINRRFAAADRYLRDSGVFYRVYEDPAGVERPWPLSHIPLLIEPSEWRQLEAGLIQRAELLEAVLADVYGTATARPRRPFARSVDRRQSGVPAATGGRGAAGRRASAVLRGRRRPRRRRPLVGAGRSRAGALGRRLRDRKPPRTVARDAGHLSRARGSNASRRSSRRCRPDCRRSTARTIPASAC